MNDLAAPTGSTSPSCRTRSTLAWVLRLMSPTSSRKIVPPSACTNLPTWSRVAPVNEPFTWPNSSDSISSSGIAAQLTLTKGFSARVLLPWMARATSSLPVPDSPVISTVALVGAARATASWTSPRAGEEPIIRLLPSVDILRVRFSSRSRRCSMALRRTSSTRSRSSGFSMKSNAPSRVASTAVAIVPCPEIITTGRSGSLSRSLPSTSRPSMRGILMSSSTTSGRSASTTDSASGPVAASRSCMPSYSRIILREARISCSSSATRTRA